MYQRGSIPKRGRQDWRRTLVLAVLLTAHHTDPLAEGTLQMVESNDRDTNRTIPAMTYLPLTVAADYLLVDDVNQDQNPDVILTSHGGNAARVFFQRDGRQWHPGPLLPQVGFHPGIILPIPDRASGHRYLALAEGDGQFKVMVPEASGDFAVQAVANAPAPRAGTWFTWPGWGLGLAFGPYHNSSVFLVKGFDPSTPGEAKGVELPFLPAYARVEALTTADIDQDGIDEILFFNSDQNSVNLIRYPGPERLPKIETPWILSKGGRAQALVAGDLDQDGDIDIMVPDETGQDREGTTAITLFLNKDKGDWDLRCIKMPFPTGEEGLDSPGIRSMDFAIDRDGQGYILAAGYQHLVLIRIPPGWGEGDEAEIRLVAMPKKTGVPQLKLQDLDGDGWLDAVLANGLGAGYGGRLIYGPLWAGFAALEPQDFIPAQPDSGTP